jgi:hypothetical protein
MATSYFIRLRGNVQGPFDAERLRQLARRGQFTRLHEVSADGQEWRPAGELSELFSVAAGVSLPSSAALSGAGHAVSSPATRASIELPPGAPQEAWYYESAAGQPRGPVDLATLQKLLEQGQLTRRSRVWKAGMADWTPAGNVPQLAAIVTQPAPGHESHSGTLSEAAHADRSSETVLPDTVEVLEDSRKWVLLLGAAGLVVTVELFLVFLGELIAAAMIRSLTLAALSLVPLAVAILAALGPWLLWRYAHGISTVAYTRRPRALYQALKVLRGYWMYASILCTIVVVVQILAVVIQLAMLSDMIAALFAAAQKPSS